MSGDNRNSRVIDRTTGRQVKLAIKLLRHMLETVLTMRRNYDSLLQAVRYMCAAMPDCMPRMP
jgi:hypothetical protein